MLAWLQDRAVGSSQFIIVCIVCVFTQVGCGSSLPRDTRFSALAPAAQDHIRQLVEPPSGRYGCYSTPMYYLMHAGYEYRGDEDKQPDQRCYPSMKGKTGPDFGHWKLDRNRPDWQEAMVRNWAELGLNSTHLNVIPVDGNLTLSTDYVQALRDYVRLSQKYGLKIGVRLDAIDETVLWSVHPANPENRRTEYLAWAKQVAGILKGQTVYYLLGDELTLHPSGTTLPARGWTPLQYLDYFKQVSAAIKAVDPAAKVSMFGASSGEWFNVLSLLENGYAGVGDGVAVNHYDYTAIPRFIADRDRLAPGKLFLTSGVGYVSLGTVQPRYPQGDAYGPQPTEEAHAAAIARTMFSWWDVGADTAPYYLSLRNWVMDGKTYPRWFGFFGFEDFVVEHDQLTVKRHAGWYAYQTIAHVFYNRGEFKPPAFEVAVDQKLTQMRMYEHQLSSGSELVMMLWNDTPVKARVRIRSTRYRCPVRVSLSDFHRWSDVDQEIDTNGTTLKLKVGPEPVIIRLVTTN